MKVYRLSAIIAVIGLFIASGSVSAAGLLPLSQTNINLNVGENLSVTAFPPSGQRVNILSNSNVAVAHANVFDNTIVVYGLAQGFSSISFCTYDNFCNTINITVGGGQTSQITFSENNFNIQQGQFKNITIFGSNSSPYVSSNSNPGAVEVGINNTVATVYGRNAGTSTITICSTNSLCGNLTVTVNQTNLNPYFITNTLPQPYVNQFYSTFLNVAGGNTPYSFTVESGSLPSGLILSSTGQIFGTPTNNSNTSFTVRVRDNFGRVTISPVFSLQPFGSISGALIYNNGTLINDNGTIYITYKNTKSGFANMSAFQQLGYKSGNIISASSTNLVNTNYVINTSNVSHPWGTWLKLGNTIYFSHENGLIPIASYDVFINNGGVNAQLVNMNSYDANRPILPIMTLNDNRLRP